MQWFLSDKAANILQKCIWCPCPIDIFPEDVGCKQNWHIVWHVHLQSEAQGSGESREAHITTTEVDRAHQWLLYCAISSLLTAGKSAVTAQITVCVCVGACYANQNRTALPGFVPRGQISVMLADSLQLIYGNGIKSLFHKIHSIKLNLFCTNWWFDK